MRCLGVFLHETEDMFTRIAPGSSTQLNESLHARKGKAASKDIAWQGSTMEAEIL
jgi:hypothetical protein